MTVNDNANILDKMDVRNSEKRKQYGIFVQFIKDNQDKVGAILARYGYAKECCPLGEDGPDKDGKCSGGGYASPKYCGGSTLRFSELVRATIKALRSGDQRVEQELIAAARPANGGNTRSNFDPATIAGALSFIKNLFGGSQPPRDTDISQEIIELKLEQERQAAMRNLFIFGGIALLAIIGTVIVVKATK